MLLQVPGSDQLIAGAVQVNPQGSQVYGYLILVLVIVCLTEALVIRYLYLELRAFSGKMQQNAIDQTSVFKELSMYMDNHNDSMEAMGEQNTAATSRILGRISSTARKLQRNEPIPED